MTSYDRPPTTKPALAQESPPSLASEPPPAPEAPIFEPEPPLAPVIHSAFAVPATAVGADHVAPQSIAYTTEAGTEHSSATRVLARVAVPPATDPADHPSALGEEDRSLEPLSRPLKIAYGVVFVVLALSALGLAYVHLRPTGGGHSTHAAAPTTTSLAPRTTSTTVALPTALQPGAQGAATALVSSWSTGNKAAALTVATPAAVTTLFAVPYTSGLAIDRGCSTSFMPIVCTFGPPGGASPSDPIYQIDASQTAGGWYVSSVRIEN